MYCKRLIMLTYDMLSHRVVLLVAINELEHEQNIILYMDHKDEQNDKGRNE